MEHWKERSLTITDLTGKIKGRLDYLPNLKQWNFFIETEAGEFSEEEIYNLAIFILKKQTHFNPSDFKPQQ